MFVTNANWPFKCFPIRIFQLRATHLELQNDQIVSKLLFTALKN